MKKMLLLLLLVVVEVSISYCQSDSLHFADGFVIKSSSKKAEHSLYKSIVLLDCRESDTADLGFVEYKKYDKPILFIVKPAYSLQKQVSNVLDSLNLSLADSGKLLLQLYRFKFSEFSTLYKDQRFFFFRANLYSVSGNGYLKLDQLETEVSVGHSKNEKKLYNAASDIVNYFIEKNLSNKGQAPFKYYSYNEVVNMDSVDKQQFKLYTTDSFVNGVYFNYESFKNQIPDCTQFRVNFKNGKLKTVEKNERLFQDELGNPFPNLYAVVTDNKMYIQNDDKFYLIEKKGNDFFFTGKIKFSGNNSMGSALLFSANAIRALDTFYGVGSFALLGIAASLASLFIDTPQKKYYEVKINYTDGSFIPVREINDKKKK